MTQQKKSSINDGFQISLDIPWTDIASGTIKGIIALILICLIFFSIIQCTQYVTKFDEACGVQHHYRGGTYYDSYRNSYQDETSDTEVSDTIDSDTSINETYY